jgi:hypothetical protein
MYTFIRVFQIKSASMANLPANMRLKVKTADIVFCRYVNGSGKIIFNKLNDIKGFFPSDSFDSKLVEAISRANEPST